MRYLTFQEVVLLHGQILERSGGSPGLRDLGGLESAIAQPRMTVSGADAYPSLESKAGALCYSLAKNHPFIDGNKRIAHAAMEVFLMLNGMEIDADIDDQETAYTRARQSATRLPGDSLSRFAEAALGFGQETRSFRRNASHGKGSACQASA